ncbi:general secretion pathway protein G [Singulisphaera sp. GP187]|uniref:type II secretion system protein n=1 Tax=Singulisphaera sp. GP187 TaxID=1882752 RepID=UPI00092A864B|nr:prepilin-type N-terminal cleavage/methylation domain-containing protein [Singulisphaera sp. GP187]SIO11745.1 general secretion pathway protein G [Singulisphaera sp. GP187]
MRRRTRSNAPNPRLGFTMIELLVVIVILGMLVGLLVPAVMRAVSTAKDAAVAAEIRAMGQALADFKSKYGEYPPSRIIVSENGDYSSVTFPVTSPPTPATQLVPRTLSYFRRFWPRMQFNTSGAAGAASGLTATNFYDINGNGNIDSPYVLTGPECLVLFLGGVAQSASGGQGWSVIGFSKNPTNPFQNSVMSSNRTVPLFEFTGSRLVGNTRNPSTSGSFPGYVDTMGSPRELRLYCYFSAYGGAGYDPDDVNFDESNSSENFSPIKGGFKASNAATPSTYPPVGNLISSPAPNPYTTDPPVPTNGTGNSSGAAKSPAWQNALTYQIISAGNDGLFGIGGQYLANGNERLPFVDGSGAYTANSLQTWQANVDVTSQPIASIGTDVRAREKDNVTNFSPGKLD